MARRVDRPLRVLGEGVNRIGRGDLNFRVDLKTGDEIENLAGEFNKMTGALQEAYMKLRKQGRAKDPRTRDSEREAQRTGQAEVALLIQCLP